MQRKNPPKIAYVIAVKNGLMYLQVGLDFKLLGATEADRVARVNGEFFAEDFVKKHDGKMLFLEEGLKIIEG